MGKIIAIDFGKKRCGIAITDELQLIASPLKTIGPEELLGFLKDICAKDEIDEIVLGYPVNLDQSATHITGDVEKLHRQLNEKLEVPCQLYDERFTSKMALDSLIQTGASKKIRKNKGLLDETSAVLLLQSYMAAKSR
ncbi:MAG: Holliday junction resolvase RuvX [Bacteroidota bacterium]